MPKTTTAKKTTKTNGVSRSGAAPKRTYERTTPVGRVQKHLIKAQKIASFAVERMSAWEHSAHPDLVRALDDARHAASLLDASSSRVARLREEQWTPPKKSTVVVYSEGDEVRITEKYREKYLQIYPTHVIDNLVVNKCLDTGEIAVRSQIATPSERPFIVAKSHLEKRRSKTSSSEASSSVRPK